MYFSSSKQCFEGWVPQTWLWNQKVLRYGQPWDLLTTTRKINNARFIRTAEPQSKNTVTYFQTFNFPPTVMSLAPVYKHRKIEEEKKLHEKKSIFSKYFVDSLVTPFSLTVLFSSVECLISENKTARLRLQAVFIIAGFFTGLWKYSGWIYVLTHCVCHAANSLWSRCSKWNSGSFEMRWNINDPLGQRTWYRRKTEQMEGCS